jgi:hypothetical protein
MFFLRSICFLTVAGLFSFSVFANETDDIKQQLAVLKIQIAELERRLAEQEIATQTVPAAQINVLESAELPSVDNSNGDNKKSDGIRLGGAIRTNYSYNSYSDGNKNRGGDFSFDIFRLNLNGSIDDVLLNAEIRFFDYMTVVKSAYIGYLLADDWQVQAGITQVPFGNWPYNSHNYFFSTNYYLGLEDDYDLGIVFKRQLADSWQLDLGFFKNDELGGVDGFVSNRSDRYSYDVVGYRLNGDGIYDEPAQPLGEYNTFAGRFAYHFEHHSDFKTELGISALAGGLHNGTSRAGNYNAWALHVNSHYQRWNLQLQHGEYRYNLEDDHGTSVDRMAVGAYAFYDSIAAHAKTSTLNLAYSLPIAWGPVTGLQIYNNYGLVYDKSDNSRDTVMNVTGFSVAAGALFTYFDLVHARNQPFAGGSLAGDSGETERRFNINVGYYF